MEAAILAAGLSGPAFRAAHGVERKCLVDIAGRPMIRWVVDAMLACDCIDRVVVVGPEDLLPHMPGAVADFAVVDDTSLDLSLRSALGLLHGERVLLAAADCPLVTGPILDAFVGACRSVPTDVCLPVASADEMRCRLGAVRKTWYRLRDGTFAKGNVVVARPAALAECGERLATFLAARKRKAWPRLMGLGFAERLAARLLSLEGVEAALSAYLGCRVALVHATPELICDVDEPEDVAVVRRVLAERMGAVDVPTPGEVVPDVASSER